MKKLSASDIALNVIRFGLIAAIVVTVVMRFTSNGAVSTISINDVESAPLSSSDMSTASLSAASAGTTHEITQDYNSGLININTATASQLTALNGIGETKAAAIVEYREQYGDFGSVDELLNVPGIGEKTLANIRGQITV